MPREIYVQLLSAPPVVKEETEETNDESKTEERRED